MSSELDSLHERECCASTKRGQCLSKPLPVTLPLGTETVEVDLYHHSIHQKTNKYVIEIKFHCGCIAAVGHFDT